MNFINTCFKNLVNLLYPAVCAGCGSDMVKDDQLLCLDCVAGMPLTGFYSKEHNPVEKIFWGRLPLVAAASYVYFTKQSVIQTLLHELKYRGNKEVGLYFGRLIGEELKNSKRFDDASALVPLPLHVKKQKKRGYNQAEVISEGISEQLKIPVLRDAVIRKSETGTQTRMNRMKRWENIGGKFEVVKSSAVNGKHVILVDDVITTGATLESCGSELLKTGNVRLSIASLAYTLK